MQNAAFAATLRVIHRNKYWRPLVSSYDDPRWYEQPKADEWYRSTPDEQFNLPSAVNSNTSKPQQAYPEDPQLDGGRRLGQIFGQIVVTVTLMIIAFLGGWLVTRHLVLHTSIPVINLKVTLISYSRPGISWTRTMLT